MFLKAWAITLCLLIVPDISMAGVAFSDEEAMSLAVEIQAGRQAVAENEILKDINQNLELEIKELREIISAKEEALKGYAELLKDSQRYCEEILQPDKSSAIKGILGVLGGIGIGILIGMAL